MRAGTGRFPAGVEKALPNGDFVWRLCPAPCALALLPLPARRCNSKMVAAVCASRMSGLLSRALPRVGRPMSSGAHGEEGSGTGSRVGVGPPRPSGDVAGP